MYAFLLIFVLEYLITPCNSWNRWDFSTTWLENTDDLDAIKGRKSNWYETWGYPSPPGSAGIKLKLIQNIVL